MPIVNVYSCRELLDQVVFIENDLRDYVASVLAIPEFHMDRDHISLRLIEARGAMIGEVELEILAHNFEVRVARHDSICAELREMLEGILPSVPKVRVWLILAETGYSYTDSGQKN